MEISEKLFFPSLPPTKRATGFSLGGDPKGKKFLYCTVNSVVIRDIEDPSQSDSYYDHQKQPTCAKYAPSGYYICSGDAVGNIRIWDTTQAEHLMKHGYQPISGSISDIAWDSDSKRIGVCGQGREKYAAVVMWDTGTSVGKIEYIEKVANSIDIKRTRPYRCAVASDDFKTYFYEGPPFKHSTTLENGSRFSTCVRFSPDGKFMAAGNADGNIYLSDGKTGEFIGTFGEPKSHNGGVYSICFSPDSSELLSASADKSCKIWNVESREMVVHFVLGNTVDDQQLSCLWQGEHLLSVSFSGEIKYLDRNNPNTPLRVLSGHNKSITCLAVKLNESIFSVSFDGVLVKWNPETAQGVRFTGKGHGTKVSGLVYDPDSNKLISAGIDNKVRFTDCDDLQFSPDSAVALDSEPFSLALLGGGNVVVACDKELVLIKNEKKVFVLPWNKDHQTIMDAQGNKIVVSGQKTVELSRETQQLDFYEIDGNKIVKSSTSLTFNRAISGIFISPDGAKVAIIEQKLIKIYDLADLDSEKPSKTLSGHSTAVKCLGWSPNNQFIASVSIDSKLYVWNIDTEKFTFVPDSHKKTVVRCVTWLNDNTFLSAAEDSTIKQWNVKY